MTIKTGSRISSGFLIISMCLALLIQPHRLNAQMSPVDHRLNPLKDLNGYFPFKPPANLELWENLSERRQKELQVVLGLWPMPRKTELNSSISAKIWAKPKTLPPSIHKWFPNSAMPHRLANCFQADLRPMATELVSSMGPPGFQRCRTEWEMRSLYLIT